MSHNTRNIKQFAIDSERSSAKRIPWRKACFAQKPKFGFNFQTSLAPATQGSDPLPDFDEEFYLVVSDWMLEPSLDIAQRVRHEAVR